MTKSKKILGSIFAVITIVTVGINLYLAFQLNQKLTRSYKEIEQWIAIKSIVDWRSLSQKYPEITIIEDDSHLDYDAYADDWVKERGDYYQTDCNINWQQKYKGETGQLFRCFKTPMNYRLPVDDNYVVVRDNVSPSENKYIFEWDSLFGYQISITINPDGYERLKSIKKEFEEDIEGCVTEIDDGEHGKWLCDKRMYLVEVSGLEASDKFAFLVSDKQYEWLGSGAIDIESDRWRIYREDGNAYTMGDINKFIIKFVRALGYNDSDLEVISPKLEVEWMKKDEKFLSTFSSELENLKSLSNN